MKKTPLFDQHQALGAKMVNFAGYTMPVSYSGILKEHQNVRNALGIFDVSHMGEFILSGTNALDLLQKVTSNDASRLKIGDAQYSCMPNGKGGIVDDLLVYRLAQNRYSEGERAYMLVVNASNMEKDWKWIEAQPMSGVRLKNISDQTALMAVQGPLATQALQKLTEIHLEEMKYYTFRKGTLAGVDNVLISATGYTGAGGFELYVNEKNATRIWDAVMEAGKEFGILPIGLGARDTLRLEMGYCLYGNDIDDSTSPIEAGLGWITKFKKGSFIDREFLLQHKKEGVERKLVGFLVNGKRPARQGYPIVNTQGNVIGRVTSGTKSPSLGKCIGMGYVATAFSAVGTKIWIDVKGKKMEATVVKRPFL